MPCIYLFLSEVQGVPRGWVREDHGDSPSQRALRLPILSASGPRRTEMLADWLQEIQPCPFSTSQCSVQSLSHVGLFPTPWTAARQASLSITNSQSSLKLMSNESVMPSSHFTLCCPLLLLPPVPPSIRVFSNESTLHMRWPKYWSFSFRIILITQPLKRIHLNQF